MFKKKMLCMILATILSLFVVTGVLAVSYSTSATYKSFLTTNHIGSQTNAVHFDSVRVVCSSIQYEQHTADYFYCRPYDVQQEQYIGGYTLVACGGASHFATISNNYPSREFNEIKLRIYNAYYHENGITTIKMSTSGSFYGYTAPFDQ